MKKLLISLDLFLIAGALYGGLSFVIDPSGESLGANTSWLDKVPVDDFFLPGLFLLFAFALFPALCLIYIKKHPRMTLLVNSIIGFSLLFWVVFQFFVLPESAPIQYVMLVLGSSISFVCLLQRDREFSS